MNNKGMTLVELIVTFSLLLVIVIGMFNLIMDVKFDLDDKQIAKDFTEYSSQMNDDIHYDLLKNKPFAIAYNNDASKWECISFISEGCIPNEGKTGYQFKSSNDLRGGLLYDNLNEHCQGIFPCAVYAYEKGGEINFETIALNKPKKDSNNDALKKYGIWYNGVFESIPNQEYLEVRVYPLEGQDLKDFSIKVVDDIFIIDFPYYLIEHDENYGFKIAYPLENKKEPA